MCGLGFEQVVGYTERYVILWKQLTAIVTDADPQKDCSHVD